MFIAISDFTDTLSFLCCSGIQINKNNCTVELWVQVINLAVELIFVQLFYLILPAEGGMLQNSTGTPPPRIATLSWWRGLCAHMIPGAMLLSAICPWYGLPKQIGPVWGAKLRVIHKMKEKQTNKQKGAWIPWDRVTGVPPWSQSLVGG